MTVPTPLKGLSILVVEDEFLVAMQLAQMIRSLGGEVVGPASTLAAATQLLQNATVNGAVMDIRLGKESSTSLAEELLANGVPVLLTTGYSEDAVPETLAHAPRLSKPYSKTGFQLIATTHFRVR